MKSYTVIELESTPTADSFPELEVAAEVIPLVPDQQLAIPKFLAAPFLVVIISAISLNNITLNSCISNKTELKWTKEDILAAEIPNFSWLGALETAMKSCLKTGTRSRKRLTLVHPTQHTLVLPPWIVTAWLQMLPVVEQRQQWEVTLKWLSERVPTAETIAATEVISATKWGMILWPLERYVLAPISDLGVFASNGWLAERHLDLIAIMLNASAPLDGQDWWIADPLLAARIRAVQQSSGQIIASQDNELMMFARTIQEGKYKRIFLPTHVDGNHWILFQADIGRRTFSYGMSPGFQDPVNIRDVLPSCCTLQVIP